MDASTLDSEPSPLAKPPVEPIYWQSAPSSTIDFGKYEILVLNSPSDAPVEATVKLHFVPAEATQITIPSGRNHSSWQEFAKALTTRERPPNVKLKIASTGIEVEAFSTRCSTKETVYGPAGTPVNLHRPSNSISRAVFHLINWPDFRGGERYQLRISDDPILGVMAYDQIKMAVDGWKVLVAAQPETSSSVDALKNSGGFIITHVGELRRQDGSVFSTEQLGEMLYLLSFFFAFTLGRWSGPHLCVAFDQDGNRVFDQWGLGQCTEFYRDW